MDTATEVAIGRTFIKEIMKGDDILLKVLNNSGRPYRYLGQYAAMLRRTGIRKTQIELLKFLDGLVNEIAAESHREFKKHNRYDKGQKRWIPKESVNG